MSLIITSNTPENDVNTATAGINLPYSYTNHLQGTLKIPPNSQIAVQSVKINKTGNIQLNKFNTQFGFYIGRDQDNVNFDLDEDFNQRNNTYNDIDNNSLMVSTYILPKDQAEKNFSYNTDKIAEELQIAWNKAIYHPNLLENASADQGGGVGGKVIPLRNASGQGFQGWQFSLTNASIKPKNSLPPENRTQLEFINSTFGGTAPGYGLGLLTNNNTTEYEGFIGTNYPLNLLNGSFNCSFGTHRNASAYSEFAIGLTRSCLPSADNAEDLPTWFKKQGNPFGFQDLSYDLGRNEFFDWCICSVWIPGIAKHALKVFHNVNVDINNIGPNGLTQMSEFDYYSHLNGGNYFYFEDVLWKNVIFNVQNERMTIRMENGSGAHANKNITTGADTGGIATYGTVNAYNSKPVCPSTRFLYPKLLLKPTKNMNLTQYYGVDVKNHVYGAANFKDLWAQSKSKGFNQIHNSCRFLDTNIVAPTVATTDTYHYKTLNWQSPDMSHTGGDAGIRLELNARIVSAPRPSVYINSTSLNTNKLLGFSRNSNTKPGDLFSIAAEPNIVRWTSNTVPALVSTESIFVRLKNMTFESANFSNSAMSKILYHVPTFDNSGNSVGSLHLEPSEMVFLDLNNPTDIHLSTIEVDLIFNNEQLATGLEGKSCVVFYIRQKMN